MIILWFVLVFLIGLLIGAHIAYKQDKAEMELATFLVKRLRTENGRLETENGRLILENENLRNGYISTSKEE